MTIWSPEIDEAGPVYLAINRALEHDIAGGRLRPGDRLPTHRDLAATLGVNVGTVSRAYAEARRRGLIEGEVGRGTFVRARTRSALSQISGPGGSSESRAAKAASEHALASAEIDLSINIPLALPGPDLAGALSELSRHKDLDAVMAYQDPAGPREAREAGSVWLRQLGIAADPDQIVLCAGAQHAIVVALGAVAAPGDLVLCEALTYPGFIGAARMLGMRTRGVAMDAEGLIPEALEAICRSERPRALYCMPSLQNPTCAQLSRARREEIADIAKRYDLMLIQDEIQGSLIDDPNPSLAEPAPDHVLTIASLSKVLSPGIRVAYLAGPQRRAARLAELVWNSVWMTSPLGGALATRWVMDGTLDEVLRSRREAIDERHSLAARVLTEIPYFTRAGSYQIWLPLPDRWTGEALTQALSKRGVKVSAAAEFRSDERAVPNAIRVSLSAPADLAELETGLGLIRQLLDASPGPTTLL